MPMKLKTTPTTPSKQNLKEPATEPLQPKATTLWNILTFAATYSVDKLSGNCLCDILMN